MLSLIPFNTVWGVWNSWYKQGRSVPIVLLSFFSFLVDIIVHSKNPIESSQTYLELSKEFGETDGHTINMKIKSILYIINN